MAGKYTILDTTDEVCPIPLLKARKSLDKLEKGEILIIIGTHDTSKVDIIKAVKGLEMRVIKVEMDKDGKWHIFIRKL